MKKILVILFTLLTCYSFGQTIHSNNLYTRMQIFTGWTTVKDTAFNVSRASDSLTISIRNDKANFYYTGDSINFYGTGGAVAKTNIGGGSSASGPAYSIQWRDPSGGLHGSPDLEFDTTTTYKTFSVNSDFFLGRASDSLPSIHSDLGANELHFIADYFNFDGGINYTGIGAGGTDRALYINTSNTITPITSLTVPIGGTGLTSLSQGDLIYGSAANTFSKLAKNTSATRYLSNTGSSNNPAWAQIDLTNGVTGTLPAANLPNAAADGSTKGAASFTANDFNSSSGNISIDYTNGQLASAGQNGFLRSSDFTTFNKFNRYATTVALKFDDAGSGTLTELFDEFTNTFSLNDIGDGSYTITAGSGIFTADKTFVTFSEPIGGQTSTFEYTVSSTTTIDFNVYSIGDAGIRNDFATNIQIIITVYP